MNLASYLALLSQVWKPSKLRHVAGRIGDKALEIVNETIYKRNIRWLKPEVHAKTTPSVAGVVVMCSTPQKLSSGSVWSDAINGVEYPNKDFRPCRGYPGEIDACCFGLRYDISVYSSDPPSAIRHPRPPPSAISHPPSAIRRDRHMTLTVKPGTNAIKLVNQQNGKDRILTFTIFNIHLMRRRRDQVTPYTGQPIFLPNIDSPLN